MRAVYDYLIWIVLIHEVREAGVEPAYDGWKPPILPLDHSRSVVVEGIEPPPTWLRTRLPLPVQHLRLLARWDLHPLYPR